jgi:hypothetical protein
MSVRRFVLVWLVSLCGLAGGLVFGAGAAFAEVSHPFLSSFDGSGTPAGSFVEANALAVDGPAGDVYVSDSGHKVIDKFSAAGAYLCQITGSVVPSASECNGLAGSVTPVGSIEPFAIAVDNSGNAADPSLGDLYVVDSNNGVVDKFSAQGAYLGAVGEGFSVPRGVGVDGRGNVWVTGGGFGETYTDEFDSSGNLVFHFRPVGFARHFAVDSNGFTYTFGFGGLEKYGPTGETLGTIDESGSEFKAAAVDQSTDDVYSDDTSHVAEYDSHGAPVVQFGAAQLASGGGGAVAVNPITGEVYVANETDGRVYVFGPAPGPRVMAGAVTNVRTTSATVGATVNPEGSDTTYQFEYGTSTAYGLTVPAQSVDVGSGGSPVAASAALSGLRGGTVYHYRVVAGNANGGPIRGADRSFETLPVPVIDGVSVSNVAAGSVDLGARINPRGSETTYHFELGTSTAYGTIVPASAAGEPRIPAGSSDVSVMVHVSGLSANTTYHWRVVATNVNGTTASIDHVFVYDTTGAGLPDGRAYELVTPADKNGALVGKSVFGYLGGLVSGDGSRVMMNSVQCFVGAVGCNALRGGGFAGDPFEFTRTGGGWVTTALAPPATRFDQNAEITANPDSGTALFSLPTPPLGNDDFYVRQPDGSFLDVGPLAPPVAGKLFRNAFLNGRVTTTADFSHVVYTMGRVGGFWPFDATTGYSSGYEYVGTGNTAPVLVAVSGGRGSTDLISRCGAGVESQNGDGALSVDGSTVFFTAEGHGGGECFGSGANEHTLVPADEVFARIGESRTVLVSGRSPLDCTSAACLSSPAGDARFENASVDGSKAFFTSTQQLTDNASEDNRSGDTAAGSGCSQTVGVNGCNLYEYDFANPAGHGLLAVSAGDASGGGPRVQGVVAVSADGSHVYFVAKGVLSGVANGRGQVAQDGVENLYVFERDASHPAGQVSFIAVLPASDQQLWQGIRVADVTPDGRFLVFVSYGSLTADDTSGSGAGQVFRYDAQSGELVRISTGSNGFNDNGNAGAVGAGAGDAIIATASGSPVRRDPTMSDDGSYVFFQSPVGLTARALDDVQAGVVRGRPVYAENLYEWHEGHVYLISDGRDTSTFGEANTNALSGSPSSSVILLGSDASGANVFFTTTDRLVGQDTDTQLDVYDARIGGGFPFAPPVAGCQGEACREPAAAPPSLTGPVSASFAGAGNLTAPAAKVKKARPGRHRHRKPRHKRARRAVAGKHIKRGRR